MSDGLCVILAAILVYGGAFGCQSHAPPERPRDIDDLAVTREQERLVAKFDVVVREPVRRRLRKLLARPVMGVTSARTIDLAGRAVCPRGWATIYVGEFALALPPEEMAGSLLSHQRLARLELRDGWSLNVFPAAPAAELSGETRRLLAPLFAQGQKLFPRGSPLHAGWELVEGQFEEHLVLDSDLELLARAWSTNLHAINIDRLTTAELGATWQLAAAKGRVAGAMDRVVAIEGAHFGGHLFGDPASSKAICFQGFDKRHCIFVMLTRAPRAWDRPIAEDLLLSLIASLRPQDSATPAADMVSRAEHLIGTGDAAFNPAVVAFLRSAAQYASLPVYRRSIEPRLRHLGAETNPEND